MKHPLCVTVPGTDSTVKNTTVEVSVLKKPSITYKREGGKEEKMKKENHPIFW